MVRCKPVVDQSAEQLAVEAAGQSAAQALGLALQLEPFALPQLQVEAQLLSVPARAQHSQLLPAVQPAQPVFEPFELEQLLPQLQGRLSQQGPEQELLASFPAQARLLAS
jgi:hypothetical protein